MKATCLFLMFTLLFGLIGPAHAESLYLPLADPGQPVLSAVGVGDSLYALLESGDILVATEQAPAFVPYARGLMRRDFAYPASQNLDQAIAVLLNIDEQLHGINLASGIIYRIAADQGQAILSEAFRLDWPRELAPGLEDGHLYPKPISQVTVAGGKLLLIHADQNAPTPGTAYTYLFDLTSGQGSRLAFENASRIASSDGQTLWAGVLTGEHLDIHHISLATGQGRLVARMKRLTGGFVARGPDLFCADDERIWRITETGETHKLSQVPASFDLNTAGQIINDRFLIAGPERVDLISLKQGAELAALTIYGNPPQEIISAYQQAHPQVALRRLNDYFANAESLVQQFLTRDDTYDLYFLDTAHFDIAPLMNKGYFVDLRASSLIADSISKTYPAIQAALTREGRICAAPVTVGLMAPSLFPNIIQDKLPGQEPPATFAELNSLVRSWYALGLDEAEYTLVSLYQARQWLLDELMAQYINWYQYLGEPLSFDTEVFRDILRDYEETASFIRGGRKGDGDTPSLLYPAVTDLLAPGPGGWSFWQPFALSPTDAGPSPMKASLTVCLINPFSKNIPLALAFIEHLVANTSARNKVLLYPEVREVIINPDYEADIKTVPAQLQEVKEQVNHASGETRARLEATLADLQARMDAISLWGYVISPEDLEMYKNQLAPRFYFPGPSILDTIDDKPAVIRHEVDRYAQGHISLEQFIQQLEQRVRLMHLEGEE